MKVAQKILKKEKKKNFIFDEVAKWLRTSRRRRCTVPALAARLAVPPSQVRSLVRRRGSCRRQARRTSQRVEVVQLVSATRSAVAAAAATGSARRSARAISN